MRRALGTLLCLWLTALAALAAPQNPTLKAKAVPAPVHPGELIRVEVTASIPKGSHIYSIAKVKDDLITRTEVTLESGGLSLAGELVESTPKFKFDKTIDVNVGYHEETAVFSQAVHVPRETPVGTKIPLGVSVRFQACDDSGCLAPTTVKVPVDAVTVEAGPVRSEYTSAPVAAKPKGATGGSLLGFLATAFGAGLLALITPCVFPLIPVTFAYFTKLATEKGEQGGEAVVQKLVFRLAILYCVGIVLSFIGIGIGMAVFVGASSATQLAANPIVNVAFGVLFVVFGLALLELFELRLPGKVQNLAGSGRKKGGYIGVFLMGLTFVISAFTCAAPFVGTVMVAAASGKELFRPIIGMAVFALAMALPFFLIALFPSLLKKLPKSGEWLTTVKGAMGFLELVAATKFFSNADQVWFSKKPFLTQPIALVLIAVIMALGGVWLLGRLKLGHNTPGKPTPVRAFWAGLFLSFSAYCLYGLSGRPLQPLMQALLPPARNIRWQPDWVTDLEKAKQLAKAQNKAIFINFTGHACQNCRDVEFNVIPEPPVRKELGNFIAVELHTDAGTEEENRNAQLELKYAESGVNPQYVVLDADGNRKDHTDYNLARYPDKFAEWLKDARTKN